MPSHFFHFLHDAVDLVGQFAQTLGQIIPEVLRSRLLCLTTRRQDSAVSDWCAHRRSGVMLIDIRSDAGWANLAVPVSPVRMRS